MQSSRHLDNIIKIDRWYDNVFQKNLEYFLPEASDYSNGLLVFDGRVLFEGFASKTSPASIVWGKGELNVIFEGVGDHNRHLK